MWSLGRASLRRERWSTTICLCSLHILVHFLDLHVRGQDWFHVVSPCLLSRRNCNLPSGIHDAFEGINLHQPRCQRRWSARRYQNVLGENGKVLRQGRLEVGVLQDLISQPAVAFRPCLTAPKKAPLRLRTWSWSCRSACSLSQTLQHHAFSPEFHRTNS